MFFQKTQGFREKLRLFTMRILLTLHQFAHVLCSQNAVKCSQKCSQFIPAVLLTRSAEDDFFDNDEYSDDAEFLEWFGKKTESFPIDKRILLQSLAESKFSGRDFAERMGVPNSSMNNYLKAEFRQLVQQYYQEVGR